MDELDRMIEEWPHKLDPTEFLAKRLTQATASL